MAGAEVEKDGAGEGKEDEQDKEGNGEEGKKEGGAGGKGLEVQFDDGRKKGDIVQVARFFSRKCAMEPVSMEDRQLAVEASEMRVTIFLGNLPADWGTDAALREAMEQYGQVERCFTMRNRDGESKDYAFVEFTLPSAAAKCKEVLDKRASETFERLFSIKTRGHSNVRSDRQSYDAEPRSGQDDKDTTAAKTNGNRDEPMDAKEEGEKEAADGQDGSVNDGKAQEHDQEAPPAESGAEAGAEKEAQKEQDTEGGEDQEMGGDEAATQEPRADAAVQVAEEKGKVESVHKEATPTPAPMPQPARSEVREKILRPEWSTNRTVASMFGRTLYVANLPLQDDDGVLKRIFGQYGPVLSCNFGKTKITGYGKGFGFVEFSRSDHADAAFRALDRVDHPELGCLLITFVNPSKTDSEQRTRLYNRKWTPQSQRYGYAGGRGAGGGRGIPPANRPYSIQPSRGGRGLPGQGYGYGAQMQSHSYGMGGRVQPTAQAAGAGRGSHNMMAMAYAQQQINAARAHQQIQLRQMQMMYQQQTAQMQAQYQNQVLQAQRQSRQAMEQLAAEKKATQQAVAAAQARQQAAAAAAAKSSQQASAQPRPAQQVGARPQVMSQQQSAGAYQAATMASRQQVQPARQGGAQAAGYGSQGYMYSGQQATQQSQAQQPQAQQQAQAYGQQGYYQSAYTQPSSYNQQAMYQQQYATAAAQPTAYTAQSAQTATGYGAQSAYQSGYGTAQQQQQQQYAAAYGQAQPQAGYGATQTQTQAGYGTTQAAYGTATQSGYGAAQHTYGQAGYGQGVYGQQIAQQAQQAAGQQVAGQKRDGTATQYQAGYGYDASQGSQDYKRARY
ncbi:unnamed protein product [Ostreobium quekettii]|uniref:RRM domain-containing protein n=1 Tax=Ostreobium quekettii TaxID=121088 RepID=A0A8S1J5N3_9CHLO|nr:unnamed protein product [Ostreobium quekettii]|eukprot:evm.model.scf_1301EXC.6 EVM.evm.TU.scf_1301EXC.6   scf_1301EXC:42396-44918(+)